MPGKGKNLSFVPEFPLIGPPLSIIAWLSKPYKKFITSELAAQGVSQSS
jgi:hypothetical protein